MHADMNSRAWVRSEGASGHSGNEQTEFKVKGTASATISGSLFCPFGGGVEDWSEDAT